MPTATLKQPAAQGQDFSASALAANAAMAIEKGRPLAKPFRYWLLKDILPKATCEALIHLPIPPVTIGDTYGKRDSHNDARRFFSPGMQAEHSVMGAVAETFQSAPVLRAIEKLCDVRLGGSYLRIEYCQDCDGFWLEPHMDIKEKLITLQLYLNNGEDARGLGTDLYDAQKKPFGATPSEVGDAMLFLPKEPNSWHGFEKRPIAGVRRSLLINYVTDDWRSRHELSFPERKVT